MPVLYIMCGAGFAGKSTLAKHIAEQLDAELVSQDAHYFEHERELPAWGDSTQQWEKLLAMGKEKISALLARGRSVVFDNTNLTRGERDALRALASEADAAAVVVFLDTPEGVLDERQERNRITKERHSVEQHYLDEAKRKLEPPATDEEAYRFAPGMDIGVFIATLPR